MLRAYISWTKKHGIPGCHAKTFRDEYDQDYMAFDEMLMTATIFGCKADSPGMPPDGAIVTITNSSKLQLFMDKACQLTTKLANLSFEVTKE